MNRLTEEQLQALEAEGFTRNRGKTPSGVRSTTVVTVVYFNGVIVTDDGYSDPRFWTLLGSDSGLPYTDIAAFRIEKPETCE